MIIFKLAFKSISNRRFSSFLTVISIALSTALLLSVERVSRSAEAGFTQSISQTDLLVGARTGPMNLILFTVFNMGSATNNISWETYQKIKSHPQVEWTIPYSIGDAHKGFRIVGTDENFFKHYRFRGDEKVELTEGNSKLDLWDAVIGSEVARRLNYSLGKSIVVSHGVTHGESFQKHEDKPFTIAGILKPTGTAIDQSIYVSLLGMEAMHLDWESGAAPTPEKSIHKDHIHQEDLKLDEISAFFLRTKSRMQTLQLQRELNEFKDEALSAVMPTATLAQLWKSLSQIDKVLKIISFMVLCVGIFAMISSLLSSLNERRREMSILRSLGSSPFVISALLIIESGLISATGAVLGLLIELLFFSFLSTWLESEFGFYNTGLALTKMDVFYLLIVFVVGLLAGLIPAIQSSRLALKDGLTVRL